MDNWVLKGPKTLIKERQTQSEITSTQVKVKITHAMVSNFDAQVFTGILKADYPKTLGRFAVGIVTEAGAECYGIQVGDRVYLQPARCCNRCIRCKSGDEDECANVQLAGKNFDGFFRDFAVCEASDVSVLPPEVNDSLAISIETVAMAEKIFDELDLPTGSKVAVFGGGLTGTVMAQVAQYYKYIPIVVDNNASNLERAKKFGLYYTFPADDELTKNIMDATGGQMCDAAVYVTSSKLNATLPARVVCKCGTVVYTGFSMATFAIDARDLLERNVRCLAVTDGFGYSGAAINLLVNNAVRLDMFEKEIISDADLPSLLLARLDGSAPTGKIMIIKMVL